MVSLVILIHILSDLQLQVASIAGWDAETKAKPAHHVK